MRSPPQQKLGWLGKPLRRAMTIGTNGREINPIGSSNIGRRMTIEVPKPQSLGFLLREGFLRAAGKEAPQQGDLLKKGNVHLPS